MSCLSDLDLGDLLIAHCELLLGLGQGVAARQGRDETAPQMSEPAWTSACGYLWLHADLASSYSAFLACSCSSSTLTSSCALSSAARDDASCSPSTEAKGQACCGERYGEGVSGEHTAGCSHLLLEGAVVAGERLHLEPQHLETLLEALHVLHRLLVRPLGLAQRRLERLELVLLSHRRQAKGSACTSHICLPA